MFLRPRVAEKANGFPAFLFAAVVAACCLNGLPFTAGQEDSKSKDSEKVESKQKLNPTRAIAKLRSQMLDEVSQLAKRYRAADEEERAEIVKERRSMEVEIVEQVITATKERDRQNRNIKDLCYFFSRTKGDARLMARSELMENYIDSPDLGYLAKEFVKLPASEETETWLRELGESSTVEKVQGNVKFAMAQYIENLIQTIDESDEEDLDDYLTKKASEDLEAKLEELLNECVEEYSDIRSVSVPAKRMLGMMNLKVGKVAPDIVGLDLDDVEFKLSDYRGKVVVVDFWGDW